jgi:hypothetical protein
MKHETRVQLNRIESELLEASSMLEAMERRGAEPEAIFAQVARVDALTDAFVALHPPIED